MHVEQGRLIASTREIVYLQTKQTMIALIIRSLDVLMESTEKSR